MTLANGKIYQDIRVMKRTVLTSGLYDQDGNKTTLGPECNARYETIRDIIQRKELFARDYPYVIDIGTCYAYFAIRLCEDFPQIKVSVSEIEELPFVKALIRLNEMQSRIARCEKDSVRDRYDVVLMLNVLHHMPNWKEVFEAYHKRCSGLLFVEHPLDEDEGSENNERIAEINKYLRPMEKSLVGMFPSHKTPGVMRPMYTIKGGYR